MDFVLIALYTEPFYPRFIEEIANLGKTRFEMKSNMVERCSLQHFIQVSQFLAFMEEKRMYRRRGQRFHKANICQVDS